MSAPTNTPDFVVVPANDELDGTGRYNDLTVSEVRAFIDEGALLAFLFPSEVGGWRLYDPTFHAPIEEAVRDGYRYRRAQSRPRCFIAGCPHHADLVVHSHPDDVHLCQDHRHLYEPTENPGDSPCVGAGCDLCEMRRSEVSS